MFSFALGVVATLALAIYKPEWFTAIKGYLVGMINKAGVDAPADKE